MMVIMVEEKSRERWKREKEIKMIGWNDSNE